MPDDPSFQLWEGIAALSAISSLLLHASGPDRRDLHLVDPEELCCLLDIVRRQFEAAQAGLRVKTAA
jgi:hypothetical protein